MISRDHSEIIGELDNERDGHFVKYFISDRSLNGTYVNDTRVGIGIGSNQLKLGHSQFHIIFWGKQNRENLANPINQSKSFSNAHFGQKYIPQPFYSKIKSSMK